MPYNRSEIGFLLGYKNEFKMTTSGIPSSYDVNRNNEFIFVYEINRNNIQKKNPFGQSEIAFLFFSIHRR